MRRLLCRFGWHSRVYRTYKKAGVLPGWYVQCTICGKRGF